MPSLKLKPSEGVVGTNVTAMGSGFRPNISYRIQLENAWLKPGTMNNRGSFMTIFKIPPVPYGEQDILAVSQAAHQLGHATFRVIPQIIIEPEVITIGDRITVCGTGFGRSEPVQMYINEQLVNLDASVRTNPDGVFSVSLVIPENQFSTQTAIIRVDGQETEASAQVEQRIGAEVAS